MNRQTPIADAAAAPRTSPMARYRALLRARVIEADPMQRLAVELFETLHHRLIDYDPRAKAGFLRRLGRGRSAPAPQGLYLYGDVGRGKSMLMDLFFDTAPVAPKRRVHFHAFMLEVHQTIHAWRQMDKGARATAGIDGDDPIPPLAARIAEGATLLCFDEFQVTDVADAMILGRLFEALLAEGVVIVLTSNTAPDHLYEGGLNRGLFLPFIDMIKARLDLLHLAGPVDYRMSGLRGLAVYHTPLGEEAEARLDEAFARLTGGQTGAPETLDVQGRRLTIPRAAGGVARATFAGLCEAALGAADYLALARRFHTLILAGIPRMTPEQAGPARRFITLIDTLYEQRVRLICSAAAPPDALYVAGDGHDAFARTVSRLAEMQSRAYLMRRAGE